MAVRMCSPKALGLPRLCRIKVKSLLGIIAIDISPPLHSHPIRPNETVVVIAHGLTGGSHEHYVRAAVSVLTAPMSSGGLAARTVVMNFRGCNDSPVTTPKLYHVSYYSSIILFIYQR